MNAQALEAAKRAVAKAMRQRTYDRHAYDAEVFMEGVTDIAAAALEAAAPYLIREARAAELEAAADWWWAHIRALGLGTRKPIHWLHARAAAIRVGEA